MGGGRVRAFMLEENHERRIYKDITGGRKFGVRGDFRSCGEE